MFCNGLPTLQSQNLIKIISEKKKILQKLNPWMETQLREQV